MQMSETGVWFCQECQTMMEHHEEGFDKCPSCGAEAWPSGDASGRKPRHSHRRYMAYGTASVAEYQWCQWTETTASARNALLRCGTDRRSETGRQTCRSSWRQQRSFQSFSTLGKSAWEQAAGGLREEEAHTMARAGTRLICRSRRQKSYTGDCATVDKRWQLRYNKSRKRLHSNMAVRI